MATLRRNLGLALVGKATLLFEGWDQGREGVHGPSSNWQLRLARSMPYAACCCIALASSDYLLSESFQGNCMQAIAIGTFLETDAIQLPATKANGIKCKKGDYLNSNQIHGFCHPTMHNIFGLPPGKFFPKDMQHCICHGNLSQASVPRLPAISISTGKLAREIWTSKSQYGTRHFYGVYMHEAVLGFTVC